MLKIALVFLLLMCGGALSQESSKTPEVKTEQQPESRLESARNAARQKAPSPASALTPKAHSDTAENEGTNKPEESGHERSEFWPVLGYSLKITDTLLVGFTFLLFLATVALWWSTRRLVTGAERTAERQLRAYVLIQGGAIILRNDGRLIADVKLTNFGQTPGYNFKTWTGIRIGKPAETVFGDRKEFAQSSIIGPSGNISAPSQIIPISQTELDEINQGISQIYVWGQAAYTDALGKEWVFEFQDIARGPDQIHSLPGGIQIRGWGLTPAEYREKN